MSAGPAAGIRLHASLPTVAAQTGRGRDAARPGDSSSGDTCRRPPPDGFVQRPAGGFTPRFVVPSRRRFRGTSPAGTHGVPQTPQPLSTASGSCGGGRPTRSVSGGDADDPPPRRGVRAASASVQRSVNAGLAVAAPERTAAVSRFRPTYRRPRIVWRASMLAPASPRAARSWTPSMRGLAHEPGCRAVIQRSSRPRR